MRMCVGCREMKPKKELMRVVRSPEGEIAVDRTGRLPGRGAYICFGEGCLAKAQKAQTLSRALECKVDKQVYEQLALELARREG